MLEFSAFGTQKRQRRAGGPGVAGEAHSVNTKREEEVYFKQALVESNGQ
jgi:hypothetical protein